MVTLAFNNTDGSKSFLKVLCNSLIFFKTHVFELRFFKLLALVQYPRGWYLGQFLLGMCRWPLRTPISLLSVLWPSIYPILVMFGCESFYF